MSASRQGFRRTDEFAFSFEESHGASLSFAPLKFKLGRGLGYPWHMSVCHAHNLRSAPDDTERAYGVRVSLRPEDPFRTLLGADWSRTHWFASAEERDAALLEMSRKHEFSRPGDRPALVYEKVQNVRPRKR